MDAHAASRPRYWVMKGRPARNRLDDMMRTARREKRDDPSETKRPPRNWAVGDRVFLWEGAPALRIVGVAALTKISTRKRSGGVTPFRVKYLSRFIDVGPTIADLRDRAVFDGASFLKPAVSSTLYAITEDQAAALFGLLRATGARMPPWNDLAPRPGQDSGSGAQVASVRRSRTRRQLSGKTGRRYRPAARPASRDDRRARATFTGDLWLLERGLRSHVDLQNALALVMKERGVSPLSPRVTDPQFDLAWRDDGVLTVVEVKSLTDVNEDVQLRLGLGQVLHYRAELVGREPSVVAVLAVEREPQDPIWGRACEDAGVRLVWPPDYAGLVR